MWIGKQLQAGDVRIVNDKSYIADNKYQVRSEVNRFQISNSRIISQINPSLKDRGTYFDVRYV